MSASAVFALLGMLAFAVAGAHMRLRPYRYLGKGTASASDPGTVRWFGTMLLFFGTASVAFIFAKIISE